jgi:hypothetical protein
VGNIDITAHSCKLTFGTKTVNLTGDAAYELYATMALAGVPSEGAAGTISESLSHLVCTINPLTARSMLAHQSSFIGAVILLLSLRLIKSVA